MAKKTYKEDKKKLKEFFKNEEFNLKKVFGNLLNKLETAIKKIIERRFILIDKHGFPGYKHICLVPWSEISESVDYSPSWIPTLFSEGIRHMGYSAEDIFSIKPNQLTNLKRELIEYVDKENINDKSVYLYIEKYFLFEDKLYELVTGKSLKEYFLYR